jgi:hypothetical protein
MMKRGSREILPSSTCGAILHTIKFARRDQVLKLPHWVYKVTVFLGRPIDGTLLFCSKASEASIHVCLACLPEQKAWIETHPN